MTDAPMTRARLSGVFRYPVKSLRGAACSRAEVEPWGLRGDRRWMLVTPAGAQVTQREQPALALVGAELRADGSLRLAAPGQGTREVAVPAGESARVVAEVWGSKVEALPAQEAASAWLSAYLGTEVLLVHMDAPERSRQIDRAYAREGETVSFADGFPLLLTAESSLAALNGLIAQGRRPGEGPLPMDRFRPNLVVSGTAAWDEDNWRTVRIGGLVCRVVKPCGRCVVTTTDQATGERGREPLQALARHRRVGKQLLFGQNLIPAGPGTVQVGDDFEVLERA